MESIMKYINRISRCSILYRNEKLESEGLNGYQHLYIMKICQNPGIAQEELAREIYINKSNVTRQLAIMEQNGFITRQTDPADRRSLHVYPTQKADRIYPSVKKYIEIWNGILTEGLTSEQTGLLIPLLKKLAANAEREINGK